MILVCKEPLMVKYFYNEDGAAITFTLLPNWDDKLIKFIQDGNFEIGTDLEQEIKKHNKLK